MNLPVDRIVVETAYGPKIVIQDPFAPTDPSAPKSTFLPAMKPKVDVFLKGSNVPFTYAPYGKPGPTKWPLVRLSLISFAALVGYTLYRGVRY